MLDELRKSDPIPSDEERAWMEANPVGIVLRAFALAAIAITIGVSVSHLLMSEVAFPTAAFVAAP